MYQAVVFDYDDTLTVGTEAMKQQTFWEIFDALGAEAVRIAREFVESHRGTSRRAMILGILEVLAAAGINAGDDTALFVRYSETTVAHSVAAPTAPGALETFALLKTRGILLFINSATPQTDITRIVKERGWEESFGGEVRERVFGAPPGTKESNLGTILTVWQLAPHEVVVIGDGKSDEESAKAHGCAFIPVKGSAFTTGVTDLRQVAEIVLT